MEVSSVDRRASSSHCEIPDSTLNAQRSTLREPSEAPVQRIRFMFQKIGMLRFLSHLELMRALGRALRRAGVAVAYSQGFNPQPKLASALALPVGVEGRQELADLELRAAMAPEELVARVNQYLAPELHLLRAWEVPLTAPSLTPLVREVVYRVSLPLNGLAQEIRARLSSQARCNEWLARPTIPVRFTRKEQLVDVDARPQIQELVALGEEENALRWDLRLSTGQGSSVRPQVIMAYLLKDTLDGECNEWEATLRVARVALILDGER